MILLATHNYFDLPEGKIMTIKTEYQFRLPRGYIDPEGRLHRDGVMRMATAIDEIETIQDPRIQINEAYLPVVLLSRVVIQLGELTDVTPELIARLFASDLAYLEDLYQRINNFDEILLGAVCPHCSSQFQVRVAPLA